MYSVHTLDAVWCVKTLGSLWSRKMKLSLTPKAITSPLAK